MGKVLEDATMSDCLSSVLPYQGYAFSSAGRGLRSRVVVDTVGPPWESIPILLWAVSLNEASMRCRVGTAVE